MLLLKTVGFAKVVLIPGRLGMLSKIGSSIHIGALHLVFMATVIRVLAIPCLVELEPCNRTV